MISQESSKSLGKFLRIKMSEKKNKKKKKQKKNKQKKTKKKNG